MKNEVLSRFFVIGGECNYLFKMAQKLDEESELGPEKDTNSCIFI
jgi:hypothetical protein